MNIIPLYPRVKNFSQLSLFLKASPSYFQITEKIRNYFSKVYFISKIPIYKTFKTFFPFENMSTLKYIHHCKTNTLLSF